MKFLELFALGFVLDVIWARYIAAAAAKHAIRAALWSGGIYVAGGVSVISYTADHTALLPLLLGSMAGTYYGVKHDSQP